MSKVGPAILVVILLVGSGCKSAEARCAESRVVASAAWAAYAPLAAADARAAQQAYDAAEPAAREARDRACRRARLDFATNLMARGPGGEILPGYAMDAFVLSGGVLRVLAGGSLSGPTTDPCGDPGFRTYEAAAIASSSIPAGVMEQRDAALAAAAAAYDLTLRDVSQRNLAAQGRTFAVSEAHNAAAGGALAARDAAGAVVADPAHREAAAAIEASHRSWESCQAVDP